MRILLPMQRMRIQSLVGELNSHMPRAAKPMGHTTEHSETHLPDGPVDRNLLANTRDIGLISGQRRFHMPQDN